MKTAVLVAGTLIGGIAIGLVMARIAKRDDTPTTGIAEVSAESRAPEGTDQKKGGPTVTPIAVPIDAGIDAPPDAPPTKAELAAIAKAAKEQARLDAIEAKERAKTEAIEAKKREEEAWVAKGIADLRALRQQFLDKLSSGQTGAHRFTLTLHASNDTAVVVGAEVCNDAVLGIFETDLGNSLRKSGFTVLVCADQSARMRL